MECQVIRRWLCPNRSMPQLVDAISLDYNWRWVM